MSDSHSHGRLNSSQPDSNSYPLALNAAAQSDFLIASEERGLVDVTSERFCSITLSDCRGASQYHSFVVIQYLIVLAQHDRLNTLEKGAVVKQLCN